MAKRLKKQERIDLKDKADTKKFFIVAGIITVVVLILLYVMFLSS